jgi:hypothetical protein
LTISLAQVSLATSSRQTQVGEAFKATLKEKTPQKNPKLNYINFTIKWTLIAQSFDVKFF